MCVRTLVGNETLNPMDIQRKQEQEEQQHPHRQQSGTSNNNKLLKAKEKYMKIHDEMISRELKVIEERRNVDQFFSPDLADDLLVASTIKYNVFLNLLSRYYEALQGSKIFKSFLIFRTSTAYVWRSTTCTLPSLLHDQCMPKSDHVDHIREAPSGVHVGHRSCHSGRWDVRSLLLGTADTTLPHTATLAVDRPKKCVRASGRCRQRDWPA